MPKRTDIIPEITENMSPMMRQYVEIKRQHPDSILFFRLGDFYEMFYNDAEVASEELDLALTKRANGEEDKAPMCGVPFHSCESYISRLIKKGYRVAICEQTEDPAKAKKLVKRDVIRVITPGTVTDDAMLDSGSNNYLAAVCVHGNEAGLCFVDISTGELHLTTRNSQQLENEIVNELSCFSPKEVLINEAAAKMASVTAMINDRLGARLEVLDDERFFNDDKLDFAKKRYNVDDFSALGLRNDSAAVRSLCAALDFLSDTQKNDLAALGEIDIYGENEYMRLDFAARNNLELCETMRGRDKKGSLLWVLDHTRTPMGKRMISSWLELPLLSPAKITKRQNAVAELVKNHEMRENLGDSLKEIADLERLITRAVYSTANARDLQALGNTLCRLKSVKSAVNGAKCRLLNELQNDIDELDELSAYIASALVDEPPLTVREGGLIRDGFDERVDMLRSDMSGGKNIVSEIEERERERTGVKKLRIVYNRVFGYLIEIPNSANFEPPQDYYRRQTLTNCERYSTDEVKQLEGRILGARDKLTALEYEIFSTVRERAASYAESIRKTAAAVAALDTLWSFALTAYKNNYVCPEITVDGKINITEGRHPVVELLSDEPFVPNDTLLDNAANRCAIITGPNMAGKSTYMRQTAIICIMAQIGSFVPAKSAKCSIVDAVFTRVGASDDLTAGKSTFMVEMSEVASILKYATKNSLLIIDEIGRGTSTYDGMAIARAVLEYVADKRKLGAKTLFATHYHELTALEGTLDGVTNYNIAAKKRGDNILFLRRIVRGAADDSYGIEVASLAGVPHEVVKRAKAILKSLEDDNPTVAPAVASGESAQISFESTAKDDICSQLAKVDINTFTPIEAMQKLNELADKAKKL